MTGENTAATPDFLRGGGQMGALIRSLDWSRTPLGPPSTWSPALRTVLRILLVNRFPMLLWWGPEYVQFYNDAYCPIPGAKHPASLGQRGRDCWSEIWNVLGPLVDTPFHGGPATWSEDLELEIRRAGFTEETHFTVAYSAVPDETAEGGIGGVLATVHEITEKVVGERRILALRDLGAGAAEARTAEEACAIAAEALKRHPRDIPFALIYLTDADGRQARLAASAGIPAGHTGLAPAAIDLEAESGADAVWPLASVRNSEKMRQIDALPALSGMPPGPWPDPPSAAAVLPIRSNIAHQLYGFLVVGLSSRLRFDDGYRDFLELATTQLATAIANARAYEEERRRAEALAEIDRVKTAFFSNVSHEFRTPLTLMLGPIESILARGGLPPDEREQMRIAHRNSLRLLKLVNSLLDFSRIEAGRVKASCAPVDLAALTADLASNFRSATQAAGIELIVDCPPLPHPVYVDREMWEKIVLNLLSNAFKFTFDGSIAVRLRPARDTAVLTVADTGAGIPEAELPRIFDRFHRVEGTKGRTNEGAGIGLALVQELVKLHGGTVSVDSRLGEGSVFTIAIPFGSAHLPKDHVEERLPHLTSTAVRVEAFSTEALLWTAQENLVDPPQDLPPQDLPAEMSAGAQRNILLADDNADMRQYVVRVLGRRYRVSAVADGQTALREARRAAPNLILSDVMMPGLDGFGLLREVRADERLRETPVILLSARAGEESRIEGLEAGADDYLVKPFSAKELLARVESTLRLRNVRQEARAEIESVSARLQSALQAARMIAWEWDMETGRVIHSENAREIIGMPEMHSGEEGWSIVHPADAPSFKAVVGEAIAQCSEYVTQTRFIRPDTGAVRWMQIHGKVAPSAEGVPRKITGVMLDITERKEAEDQLRIYVDELRRFNRLAVGRELRIIEMKKEVNEMCRRLGAPMRYTLDFEKEEGYLAPGAGQDQT